MSENLKDEASKDLFLKEYKDLSADEKAFIDGLSMEPNITEDDIEWTKANANLC